MSTKIDQTSCIVPKNTNQLFGYVYQLCNKQSVNLNDMDKTNATSVADKIYNACVDSIKSFNELNSVEKSHLNVLLSCCLNTIKSEYRVTLKNIIGVDALKTILTTNNGSNFSVFNEPEWLELKSQIVNIYQKDGKKGVSLYVLKERQKIYSDSLEERQVLTLKIIDVYEVVLDTISYSSWGEEFSEEYYGCYWKSIFQILFRSTDILLKRGETCCTFSKDDRQLNEYQYGKHSKNIFGRKIDFLLVGLVYDDNSVKQKIELSSLEIKPENVSDDIEVKQLNKNIRVNKSILYSARNHMGGREENDAFILGVDIFGFSGFMYSLYGMKK